MTDSTMSSGICSPGLVFYRRSWLPVACMADIFISYSSLQRDVVRSLATTIEGHFGAGAVWWDQAGLRAGDRFSPEITRALDDAKAVVVVWTAGALESDWVYAEATRAVAGRKV